MAATLAHIQTEDAAPKKKTRERVCLIEAQPEASWFVQAKTEDGSRAWFLRVKVTGLHPRRFGPFESKSMALLFLDRVVDGMHDALSEAGNQLAAYQMKVKPFSCRVMHYPVVEDELIQSRPGDNS